LLSLPQNSTFLVAARVMSLRTLNDVFFQVVSADRPDVMRHRQQGQWISISSQQLKQQVTGVARALRAWGIGHKDRVAILSENRPGWTTADFASLLLGAVSVPIYATLTAEQIAYVLKDAGVRVLFVSSAAQLRKVLTITPQSVEQIVVMDAVDAPEAVNMQDLMMDSGSGRDEEVEAIARAVVPEDLATIIYTSGTTGTPKGVMLTHKNMASNLVSLEGFDVKPGQVSISFLPLSHVTARHVDFAMLYNGVTLAYVPFMEHLPQALLEVRPTIFVGVPRVYEKIHSQVDRQTEALPKNLIYRWALLVGRDHRVEVLAGKTPQSRHWKLANRLVFSKIRAGMGGRAELFISGGAPLGRELAKWYADIGIRIHEGYGLTETSPVIAVNTPGAHKLGTVGKPLPNVEVRIAADGEILVRGPSVFKGYWKKPEETENAFVDGWFKTGDIGNLDAEGFLSVTDRKKDLIKTSGGKFIAPQPIENSLKHHAFVAEAVVLGDKRKFPAVLISPNFPLLEDWAQTNKATFASREHLVSLPEVQVLFEKIVENVNQDLAQFEKLKRVLIVADEFTAEDGSLTASMKMRRRVVEERYREEIEEMYVKAEAAGKGGG